MQLDRTSHTHQHLPPKLCWTTTGQQLKQEPGLFCSDSCPGDEGLTRGSFSHVGRSGRSQRAQGLTLLLGSSQVPDRALSSFKPILASGIQEECLELVLELAPRDTGTKTQARVCTRPCLPGLLDRSSLYRLYHSSWVCLSPGLGEEARKGIVPWAGVDTAP